MCLVVISTAVVLSFEHGHMPLFLLSSMGMGTGFRWGFTELVEMVSENKIHADYIANDLED